MKRALFIILPLLLAAAIAQVSYAAMDAPYGDYCPKCSKYGVCPAFLSVEESIEAVKSYFAGEAVSIGRTRGKGRFLKIELIKDDKLYDVILFDRKTGRIRTIY